MSSENSPWCTTQNGSNAFRHLLVFKKKTILFTYFWAGGVWHAAQHVKNLSSLTTDQAYTPSTLGAGRINHWISRESPAGILNNFLELCLFGKSVWSESLWAWVEQFLAVWPWISLLTSLNCSFFKYKIEIILSASYDCFGILMRLYTWRVQHSTSVKMWGIVYHHYPNLPSS